MKNATIINVYKHDIIIKDKKKQKHMSLIFVLIFTIFIGIVSICDNKYIESVKTICVNANPVNSLYNDNSDVVFTNNNKVFDFVLPISGAVSKINDDGLIEFEVVKSIMVVSSEDGIVDDVGYSLDGTKYIKIKHSDELFSIIENIDIVGVKAGEIVKKGQDIATSKIGTTIKMRFLRNGNQITNIKINKSKISWE